MEQGMFWRYLLNALAQLFGPVPGQLLDGQPSSGQHPQQSWLVALGNSCYERSDLSWRHLLYVDGIDCLSREDFRALVGLFAYCLPHNCHLLMAGRRQLEYIDEPLLLDNAAHIGGEALAFTPGELMALMGQRGMERGHERIFNLTSGWASGIAAVLDMSLPPQADAEHADILACHELQRFLDQYFRLKALAKVPGRLQEFLIEASVLECLSQELCDYVLERPDSARMLDDMLESSLFVTASTGQGAWHSLNPLFRHWLHRQLLKLMPNRIRELCNRASEWFERQGMYDDASRHMLLSSDIVLVQQLTAASGIYRPRPPGAFTEWLLGVPAASLAADPQLCLLTTWSYMSSGRSSATLRWLDNFGRAWAKRQEASMTRASAKGHDGPAAGPGDASVELAQSIALNVEAIRLKCRSLAGNYHGTIDAVGEFLQKNENVMSDVMRLVFVHTMGESLERVGRLTEASDQYLKGEAIARLHGSPFYVSFNRYLHTNVEFLFGKLASVKRDCYDALNSTDWDYAPYGGFYCLLALVQVETGDFGEATVSIRRSLARLHPVRNADILIETLTAQSKLLAAQGRLEDAYKSIVQTSLLAEQYQGPRGVLGPVYAQQAHLAIRRGSLTDAQMTLRRLREITAPDDRVNMLMQETIEAKALLAAGEGADSLKEALRRFEAIREEAMGLRLYTYALEPMLYEAALHYHTESKAKGLQLLGKALESALEKGFCTTVVAAREHIRLMLKEMLSVRKTAGHIRAYIKRLLAAMDQADKGCAPAQPSALPSSPAAESLTRREQEVLGLLESGLSRAEISEVLCISLNTTKSHLGHIFTKLGVSSRLDAFKAAEGLRGARDAG
jgi:LuxR family maltose regulon positive regulatory protein